MKGIIKAVSIIVGMAVLVLLVLIGVFAYVTKYRYTDIDRKTSPDERCELTLQMKGEPAGLFGSTYGRILVRYDGKIIKKIKFEIRDDGAMLQERHWSVAWGLAGAEVTLYGSEQEDQIVQILYDDRETFSGYPIEQITEEMTKRYGRVREQGKEDNLYYYDTGEFSFAVKNTLTLKDNYTAECYRYLTDTYFEGRNRSHSYEETGQGVEKTYTLVMTLNSSAHEERKQFCSDVADWLLAVTEKLPYEENADLYHSIQIAYEGEVIDCPLSGMQDFSQENVAEVYNALYDFLESFLSRSYEEQQGSSQGEEALQEKTELSEEIIQFYLSMEPDCCYKTDSGMEYRMIPADRACGSSYYVLVATQDDGKSASMINSDPYLGSGGNAEWICFLEDEKTGFSCLSYSGGVYGSLYRTEDGGRNFEKVEYPSAKVKLSDGTYYNPFVMPQRIYEEAGKLYLEVGQGADGDYYGEEGFCHGLYQSEDEGRTWIYVKEISAERK